MSRISNIILRVRDTLADPNGDRWSDERLIRLIDEAQKDICRRAKLLRTNKTISIYENQKTYSLPSDMLLLDRVLLNSKLLPFKSHLEMDKKSDTWEDDSGFPSCVIYDKQNRQEIKLYPIPVTNQDNILLFVNPGYFEDSGYVADNSDAIITALESSGLETSWIFDLIEVSYHDPDFGVIVGIEGLEQNSDFGVLTNIELEGTEVVFDGLYGITTSITESSDLLTIYYLKKPLDITTIDSTIEIDECFDSAIKYYVTGKALRDDMDTQNRVVGNEELQFYDRELKEAINDDEKDFTRTNRQYTVNYTGAFDG